MQKKEELTSFKLKRRMEDYLYYGIACMVLAWLIVICGFIVNILGLIVLRRLQKKSSTNLVLMGK